MKKNADSLKTSSQRRRYQNLFGSFFPPHMKIKRQPHERSFTIIETLVAIAILLPVVIETVATQGSIINNSTYIRRMTEATWLAKRVMSQVEYNHKIYPLKDLEIEQESPFKIEGVSEDLDYTYKLTIKEWKLPLFDLLMQGGPKSDEEEDEAAQPAGGIAGIPGVDQMIDSLFEGHILKVAYVEVFWAEGARRDSVSLTLLLTNQKALDTYILSKKKVMDTLVSDIEGAVFGKKKKEKEEKPKG